MVAVHRPAVGVAGAGDGVDVAAGSGDLRLQLQRAGNTPGGEVAHGVVGAVVLAGGDGDTVADLDGTGPAVHAVTGNGSTGSNDVIGSIQGHGHSGSGVEVAGQVHAERAVHIVADDHADGAALDGGVGLLEEADRIAVGLGAAAVADGDLAGQVNAQGIPLLGSTEAVEEHELLLTGDSGQRIVSVDGGVVHVLEGLAAGHDVGGEGVAVVLDGGHVQRVGEGTGGAVHLHGHVFQVQVGIAGLGLFSPVAGVAGGNAQHHAGIHQALQDGLIGGFTAAAGAGDRKAKGHVHGIAVEDDGVLEGSHVVGVIDTAATAEDLHGQQLSVGSHALHVHGVQSAHKATLAVGDVAVGGGDTGHVGAVLTLAVQEVGHVEGAVHVVVAVGQLFAEIQYTGILQHRIWIFVCSIGNIQFTVNGGDLLGVQQIQRGHVLLIGHTGLLGVFSQSIEEGLVVKRLVIDVGTGIDDGDTGTGTGVAGQIGGGGADLLAGGGHIGLGTAFILHHTGLVTGLDQDRLDALHGLNSLDIAVLDVGGNDVGSQSQVPYHVQLLVDGAGDGRGHSGLLSLQLAAVVHCLVVGGNVLRRVAGLDGAFLIQDDGYADHVGVSVYHFVRLQFHGVPVGNIDGNCAVVNLLDGQAGGLGGKAGHGQQSYAHSQDNDQRKQTLAEVFSHCDFFLSRWRSARCSLFVQEFPASTLRPAFCNPAPSAVSRTKRQPPFCSMI